MNPIAPGRKNHRFAPIGPLLLAIGAAAILGSCTKAGTASPESEVADGDWPSYGRDNTERHFSPLRQIDRSNVGKLGLAWYLDLDPPNTVTQPLAIDGIIYFAINYSVIHAVDGVTGKLLWKYDPEVAKTGGRPLFGYGSRGIGWWRGKIYTATADGRVIAVDAKTGAPVWEQRVIEPGDISGFTAAPRIFDGVLVIGNSGDNGPMRGHLTALDPETGKRLWRFWVVPGDPAKGFERPELAMAAKTWSGEWWKYGGNGAPWNAYTYDPETGTLFVGTGNGFPFNHRRRSAGKGDNLFLSSIVALDLKSGKYKWHYQGTPADMWDYTMAQDIQLADLTINGKPRKVLLTAPKNGFFYVLDRIDGSLISARPFVKTSWASHIDMRTGRPVENPDARYPIGTVFRAWPSAFGGHNWQAMAYSPDTRLVYIPTVDLGSSFRDTTREDSWSPQTGQYGRGMTYAADIEDGRAENRTAALVAWDPVKQRRVWRVQAPRMIPAGVMATAGGLVFQGAIDNGLVAYSAENGDILWSYDTRAPTVAPPISWSAKGKQYVTVLTGVSGVPAAWGRLVSDYHLDYRTMPRRVLTFALGGTVSLPANPRVDPVMPDDPGYSPQPALAEAGSRLYRRCAGCHGYDAVSGGRAPDLRRSGIPLDPNNFAGIVRDGMLADAGMPGFRALSDNDLAALRQYIRAQAHDPSLDQVDGSTGMQN